MKKAIKNIRNGLLSLVLAGSVASAEEYTIGPETDIWKFFNKVSNATVYLENGIYDYPIDDGRVPQQTILNGITLKAKNPYTLLEDMDIDTEFKIVTESCAIIKRPIYLMDNSSVEGIVQDGSSQEYENPFVTKGKNTSIKNCFIENIDAGIIIESESRDTLIKGNIITRCSSMGIFYGKPPEDCRVLVTENHIVGNHRFGILFDGFINLGSKEVRGNNVIGRNAEKNVFSGCYQVVPAEFNSWYDKDGNFLTDRIDIEDTIRTPTQQANELTQMLSNESLVDVVPFNTQNPYGKTSHVNTWVMYE